MHFFRALWSNDLGSAQFLVKNSDGDILHYSDIVTDKDSTGKVLQYPGNLYITYLTGQTILVFLMPTVLFGEKGYYDSSGISWEGEMIKKRIGDELPYEYSPE